MAKVETATVVRELELSVRYVFDEADASTGHAADVEVLSVRIGNVDIPLTKEQWNSLLGELREAEIA